MASTSEVTFGAKIANAGAISTHLKSFIAYAAPTPETEIVPYDALIAALKAENSSIATKNASYSAAVDDRQKHFDKDPTSISKILSPIVAAVRAKMGKSSKEVADITSIMTKIRGIKTKKPKEGDKPDTISNSERSYGTITQNFSDLVTTLTALGSGYSVVQPNLKLPALNQKITDVTTANNLVTSTYGALKTSIDSRQKNYSILSERTQRIKESVKSQYGVNSTEYKLIKGLKV